MPGGGDFCFVFSTRGPEFCTEKLSQECRYKTSEIIVMDQVQTYMDGPQLLRMRLSELVALVRVELHS